MRRRRSLAIGAPEDGRLVRGVRLPREGRDFFSWDPVRRAAPNRAWRRWGADTTIRSTLRVLRDYRAANPGAARIGVGDLSRPRGGDFGARFGAPGHFSHRNGLDVDLYYPRRDRRERAPLGAAEIVPALSQELVDRFVAAGAEIVFVGPNTGLRGPPAIVRPAAGHDNHLHVRFPQLRRGGASS